MLGKASNKRVFETNKHTHTHIDLSRVCICISCIAKLKCGVACMRVDVQFICRCCCKVRTIISFDICNEKRKLRSKKKEIIN